MVPVVRSVVRPIVKSLVLNGGLAAAIKRLLFNGTDQYVTHSAWTPSGINFTISAKVTFAAGAIGRTVYVLSESISASEYLVKTSGDQFSFAYVDAGAVTRFLTLTSLRVAAGTEYTVTITSDGNGVELDVDGQSVSNANVVDSSEIAINTWMSRQEGSGNYTSGIIRDVRFTDELDNGNSRHYLVNKCAKVVNDISGTDGANQWTNPPSLVGSEWSDNGDGTYTLTGSGAFNQLLMGDRTVGQWVRIRFNIAAISGELRLASSAVINTYGTTGPKEEVFQLDSASVYFSRSSGVVNATIGGVEILETSAAMINGFDESVCVNSLGVAEGVRGWIKRNFLDSGSLVESVSASSPAISLGGTSSTLGGSVVDKDDSDFVYFGGNGVEDLGPSFPRDQFRSNFNLSFDEYEKTSIGSIVEFRISCPRFEIKNFGQGVSGAFRLVVDGEEAGFYDGGVSDGSVKWLLIDFSSINPTAQTRDIRIEYSEKSTFGGLTLDTIGSILPPSAHSEPSIVFLGDSFTEGTGISNAEYRHLAYAPRCSKELGINLYAMSGFGGTGYEQDFYPGFGSTRPNLAGRIQYDGANYDIVIVAMGINDTASSVTNEIQTGLDTARSLNPNAMIYVLGPWGNGTGGETNAAMEARISDEVGDRDGFKFISVYSQSFTKSDATHPDDAGHVTLGTFLANQIKLDLGI